MEQADIRRASNFDCGTHPVLNDWLQKFAWPNHRSGGARVYVSVDTAQDLIAAYYSLSAAQAAHADVPVRVAHGMGQSPIPVVLIGRFAVDARFQGADIGRFMIRHAFGEVLTVANSIGVRAIMLDAKDQNGANFYTHLGFSASVSNPLRLFIMLKDIRKSLAAASARP
jgi:GNAT superfamily N-acetyltransferase